MDHILYLMHIDWNWIKQRPQFIAEGLSKKYKVDVVYKYSYRNKNYQQNENELKNVTLNKIFSFPNKLAKLRVISEINTLIFRHKVKKIMKATKPKYVYITSPLLLKMLPSGFDANVIYDCMDDHYALESHPEIKAEIKENEEKLVNLAKYIFVSSMHLQEILLKRYKVNNKEKIYLIRNGFKGPILNLNRSSVFPSSTVFKIAYFGTISSWFDFDLINQSLKDFNNIEYELIGPIDKNRNFIIPQNKRIKLLGTVEHNKLYSKIKDCNALIMPFKLNDIIKSVDPVKLYEYINFDKNIVTVRYKEIQRFNDFVYFYNNYSEFKRILNKLMKNENAVKYNKQMRHLFLRENTWEARISQINHILSN